MLDLLPSYRLKQIALTPPSRPLPRVPALMGDEGRHPLYSLTPVILDFHTYTHTPHTHTVFPCLSIPTPPPGGKGWSLLGLRGGGYLGKQRGEDPGLPACILPFYIQFVIVK
jgi:hypothetical protein